MYLTWINEQLAVLGKHVDDIEGSLADGILIIQALEVCTMNNG